MNELSEIKSALKDRRLCIIAEKTGLHVNTIASIRDGKNTNPTLETLQKLADYLGVSA